MLDNKLAQSLGRPAVFADARPDELLAKTTKGQWAALFGSLTLEHEVSDPLVIGLTKTSERLASYMRASCGEGGE